MEAISSSNSIQVIAFLPILHNGLSIYPLMKKITEINRRTAMPVRRKKILKKDKLLNFKLQYHGLRFFYQ